MHRRIRVVAAAAASSVARAPSIRRLTSKGAAGQSRPGQNPKKPFEDDPSSTKSQGNLAEPLLGNKR